jgi:single-stranded DNA-binding protein
MKCYGLGVFVKDPQLQQVIMGDRTVNMCQFGLLTSEKRTDSNIIDEDIYLFTVWDSAADYIVKNARKGTQIFYEAVPKKRKYTEEGETKPRTSITFRINNFRLLND